jgi:phosphoribosylamine--glycine ligase
MSNKQKILILGAGGGREHALGWKIAQSPNAGQIFFMPGNAGTEKIGTNVEKITDMRDLMRFVKKKEIDITLAVSDDILAWGIVNEFERAGLRIWGPTRQAAQIEWSKSFSKDFMKRHNLPTAKFETFNDFEKAKEYITKQSLPIVIKADGLALGKGVIIAQTLNEAREALENIMVKKIFGDSGNKVVIEEFLEGPEISIHALSDGKNYKIFPTSQDHKRIGENDTGPNTGGMGVIGPLPFVGEKMMDRIEKEIISPALKAMRDDGIPFEGILYPSLMLTAEGPKIIEFNARFGDPECQVYMRLLDSDLLQILNSCIDKKLDEQEIKWKNAFACNVALASGGYPGSYEKGKEIFGLPLLSPSPSQGEGKERGEVVFFHAGTKVDEKGNLVTNGGRVLGVSAIGDTLQDALNKAYKAIEKISFEGMQYRKDIGKKALLLSEKK